MLHRFTYLMGRPFKSNDSSSSKEHISEHFWGDAIYIRDIGSLDAKTSEQICEMVFIVSTFISLTIFDEMTEGA